MDMQVDLLWEQARGGNGSVSLAVLMVDVDNFKKYNDTYGHQAGDDCLIRVAGAIAATVAGVQGAGGSGDAFSARYGGEEFAVILPNASTDDMQRYADLLIANVQALAIPHAANERYGVVTISIGGKRVDPRVDSIAQMFRQADAALYRSKEDGRNRASFA